MAGRKITHGEEWWASAPSHVLRCTANYKSTGLQCRREAHPGANVCTQHGALAPAVQAAAATRIQMSADDAAKKLLAMVEDPEVESREKVKILQDLLDRGGLGATSKLLVGVGPVDPVEAMFRNILTAPDGLLEPEALPEAVVVLDEHGTVLDVVASEDDVVDAELVDDEPRQLPMGRRRAPVGAPDRPSTRTPRHIRDGFARTDQL